MSRSGWACAAACAAASAYVLRGVPWGLAPGAPASWAASPAVLGAQAARVLVAAGLLAVWTAFGRALLRPLRLRWTDAWEEAAVCFALGAGAWGTCLQLAGLAGLWRPWLLVAAAAAGLWPV